MSDLETWGYIFICKTTGGSTGPVNHHVRTEKEFDDNISRYLRDCGGVKWAYMINPDSGEIVKGYPNNCIRFINEV